MSGAASARGLESADASLYASVMGYDDVLVSLVSEVASAYIDIRSFEQRIAYAEANVELQQQTLEITDVRFRAGEDTELDVQQARSNLANTEALIPDLQNARRSASYRLCFLLGMTPQSLDEMLAETKGIPAPPTDVAIGVPAELLRRRPDIRRAEREAAAQCAQIGVEVANLYPQFSLNGSIGYGADNLSDTFSTTGFEGSFGPSFRWDILNYDRIKNAVRIEDARFEQLIVSYQNTVLRAASEVESAATSFALSQVQAEALDRSVVASAKAVDLALIQYRNGEVDFTRVLDTQSFLTEQQDRLAASRRNVAGSVVSLHRALGGGWEIRNGKPFVDPETQRKMQERTDWGNIIDPDYPNQLRYQPKGYQEAVGGEVEATATETQE